MSDEHNGVRPSTAHLLGLAIVSELKNQVYSTKSFSQLEQARNHLTEPHQEAELTGSDSNPSKAMKIASNVAVRNGYSNLLELTDSFACQDTGLFVGNITHSELSHPVFSIADRWGNGGVRVSESRLETRFDWKGIKYNRVDITCALMILEIATPKEVIEKYLPEGDNE